jgi:type IV pilus assembly protein PilA
MNDPSRASYQPQASPKRGMPTWMLVIICLGAVAFVVLPIFSVVAVYGVRKYLVNAKNAEARNVLGQIALDASKTYDPKRGFCPSASASVPAAPKNVSGCKYQSARADWETDSAAHAGFACLRFSLEEPQYYQYSYTAVGRTGFTATARGDLNGDGVFSTFTVRGQGTPTGAVEISPRIEEENPGE